MSDQVADPTVTTTSKTDWLLGVYRVLAILVGFGLLTLVFVGMPLKYAADSPDVVKVVGPAHGFLYVVYLLCALQLWLRERWKLTFALAVACAGFVPFLSFYAERQVTRRVSKRTARR